MRGHGTSVPCLDYDQKWIAELDSVSEEIGRSPSATLSMQWDAREVTAKCDECQEVAAFVRDMSVDGNDVITSQQLRLLRDALTRWLFCNGNNEVRDYLAYSLESGETIAEGARWWIGEYARTENRPDVLGMPPLEQLVWYYRVSKWQTRWQGLVAEGSRIKVFEAMETDLPDPGQAIRGINRRVIWHKRASSPPVSPESVVRDRGSVTLADVEVYVMHNQRSVRPYFCRYWFDSEKSIWRLDGVVSYPCGDEPPQIVIW
jgi:hypothetical protein